MLHDHEIHFQSPYSNKMLFQSDIHNTAIFNNFVAENARIFCFSQPPPPTNHDEEQQLTPILFFLNKYSQNKCKNRCSQNKQTSTECKKKNKFIKLISCIKPAFQPQLSEKLA